MKFIKHAIALLLLNFFVLTGCDKTDVLQDKPKDDKGKKDPPLSIATVSGPTGATSDCGGFDWKVTFTLKDASKSGGWIVQKITFAKDIKNCDNSVNDNTSKTYWEAWEIKKDKKIDNERDKGTYNYDDRFAAPNHPNTKGKIDITGEVKYFDALALPATFKKNNADTYAGGLPATTEKPEFWDNKDAVDHNLNATWVCCDSSKTSKVTTVPTTGGRTVDTSRPDTSKLDNIGRMIRQIPAWTAGYDSSDNNKLTNIARQLSYVPASGLRMSLVNYTNVFNNTSVETEELSKVYVLLRSLFVLPTSANRSFVKTFGGWVHPSVENAATSFNMSWPVMVTGYGYYMQVHITGKYSGYLGRPYDAVGEFDYFSSNFEKRSF